VMNTTKDLARRLAEGYVDAAQSRLVELAQILVRAPSPNPPGDTTEIVDVVEDLLSKIPGVMVKRVMPAVSLVSVIASLSSGRPGRRLIFNGHLDTFPLGEDLGWDESPVSGHVKDGRIYGRGVCDMKGGIASSLLVLELLAANLDAWCGEIVLTLAADEESMGDQGTGYMLKNEPLALGDANICADVGSSNVVRFGEKGLYWLDLEADGSPAHGAHVHRGVNAIDRLRAALDQVKRLEEIVPTPPATVDSAIDRSKAISEPLSGAGESDVLKRVTVNIGLIAGGTSPNLVPTRATAAADIRLPVGVSVSAIDSKLTELLSPLEGVKWTARRRFEPNFTLPNSEIVRIVADSATLVLGVAPAVNMRIGASDSRWYRLYGVPTVVYGLTPHNMGGPNEFAEVDELVAVAKVHALSALTFLAVPG
jgi:succinyl-diaminopimelate desuccinylase